jgi:hypothetical protein
MKLPPRVDDKLRLMRLTAEVIRYAFAPPNPAAIGRTPITSTSEWQLALCRYATVANDA